MRYLENVNDTQTFKAGDDSETIRLSARNDNAPVVWGPDDKATVHVDKDGAHVLDFPSQLVQGSNIVTFSSSELASLPAGGYALEVWVDLAGESKQAIWPSAGMLKLTIDRNADSLEGGAITTITLDDFKKQLADAIKSTDNYVKEHAVPGPQGKPGAQGEPGKPGENGKSAYELAVESGFNGTKKEWLESLAHGPKGPAGDPGKTGADGKSAFELAEDAGFKGSLQDWLASLKGPKGDTGATGQPGAPGATGQPGQPGRDGKDGKTPVIKGGTVTPLPSGQQPQANLVDNHDGSYTLNLSIPAGPKGDVGGVTTTIDAKLSMGTVTTLGAGEKATASLVKSGQDSYVINLGIPMGPQGIKGDRGADGKDGSDGKPGKSAFEIAQDDGFKGTEQQWLDSLKGQKGETGATGQPGHDGKDGKDGAAGASAYELAVKAGFSGSQEQWLASLKGPKGDTGDRGPAGETGQTGATGQPGQNGKSAYELAVAGGYQGTEAQWLKSLVGPQGPTGEPGKQGQPGIPGKDGKDGQPGPAGKDGTRGPVVFYYRATEDELSLLYQMRDISDSEFSINKKYLSPMDTSLSNTVHPQAGDFVVVPYNYGKNSAIIVIDHTDDTYIYNNSKAMILPGKQGARGTSIFLEKNVLPVPKGSEDLKVFWDTIVTNSPNIYTAKGDFVIARLDNGKVALLQYNGTSGTDSVLKQTGITWGGESSGSTTATRGSMIFQSSEVISTRGMTSTFDSSKITSPDGKLKPQTGDWIVATSDQGVSYAFQVTSVSGTTVNVNSNQTPIQVTGNSGTSVESKAGHSVWVDTKWTNTDPIVNAWHTDFEGATLDDHPVEGDVIIGAGGGVARVDYVYKDDSNNVWIISTGKVLMNLKG